MFAYELETILIAGYDYGVHREFSRRSAKNIVSLYSGAFVTGYFHLVEYGFQKFDLRTKIVGHRLSRAFVIGIHFMSESRLFSVESDENVFGFHLGNEFYEHIDESIHGIRRSAVFGG